MIIPKEVKECIKKHVIENNKEIIKLITELQNEILALKVQISILKEGENI